MVLKRLLLMIMVFLPLSLSYAETVILSEGHGVSGRLGDLQDNILKFYSKDGYITLNLNNIRDITPDEGISEPERARQLENIKRYLPSINREYFLIEDLRNQVAQLLKDKQFIALDQLALSFMQSQARFPSGRLKEAEFYYGLSQGVPNRDVEKYRERLSLVRQWVEATGSEIARIALMDIAMDYAWAYRGSGFSNTVNEQAKVRFAQIHRQAKAIGEELMAEGTNNTTAIIKLMAVLNNLGGHNDRVNQLAIDAARTSPYYYGLHSVAIHSQLPKWGGSIDAVNTYVRRVYEKYGRKDGHQDLYFRLALIVFKRVRSRSFTRYGFNWPQLQDSFSFYANHYPVTEKHYHTMAMIAGLMGDKKGFAHYMAQTTGQWNFLARSVWRKKETQQAFKQWEQTKTTFERYQIPPFVVAILQSLVESVFNHLPEEHQQWLALYIVTKGDINRSDVYGETLLHQAASRDDIALIERLMAAGADPLIHNLSGRNALHMAAHLNRQKAVSALLAASPRPDELLSAQSKSGKTALHIAAGNGFETLVAQLIKAAPHLAAQSSRSGATALHYAASKGHIALTEQLLATTSIDINQQNTYGYSALHSAVVNHYPEIVKQLVDYGADRNLLTRVYSYTALDLAEEENDQPIINYLQAIGANKNPDRIRKADRQLAIDLYDEAAPYFTREGYGQGVSLIKQALEHNPAYAEGHRGLAILHLYYGKNYPAALEHIQHALRLKPNDKESYYTAGRVYHALGKIEESKPFFIKYVELAPDTYNTSDLKQNWSYLLVPGAKPGVGGRPPSLLGQLGDFLVLNQIQLIAVLCLCLLVLVMRRRRNQMST